MAVVIVVRELFSIGADDIVFLQTQSQSQLEICSAWTSASHIRINGAIANRICD